VPGVLYCKKLQLSSNAAVSGIVSFLSLSVPSYLLLVVKPQFRPWPRDMAIPEQIQMGSSFCPGLAVCNEFCLVQTNMQNGDIVSDDARLMYIGPNDEVDFQAMRAREDPTCCVKWLCGGNRGWEMDLTQDGVVLANYSRPMTCPLGCGKPCCYQEVTMKMPDGSPNGSVSETCWFCCSPQFNIIKPDGSVEFTIAPVDYTSGMKLLMMGACEAKRGGCIRGEIGIYSNSSVQVGKVVKGATSQHKLPWLDKAQLWGQEQEEETEERRRGLRHLREIGIIVFDRFDVSFPPEASTEARARLLGAVFLINQVFFEPGPLLSPQRLFDCCCCGPSSLEAVAR